MDIWVAVILDSEADATQADNRTARAMTHATLGLINSTPFSSRLRRDAMVELLSNMAEAALNGVVRGARV